MASLAVGKEGYKMQKYLGISYLTSLSALGAASCCILPMTLMLFGFGSSWIAVFGTIAAVSYYVLAFSTAVMLGAWVVSYRRNSIPKLKWWLAGTTTMTLLSWVVIVNGAQINDFLILQM